MKSHTFGVHNINGKNLQFTVTSENEFNFTELHKAIQCAAEITIFDKIGKSIGEPDEFDGMAVSGGVINPPYKEETPEISQ